MKVLFLIAGTLRLVTRLVPGVSTVIFAGIRTVAILTNVYAVADASTLHVPSEEYPSISHAFDHVGSGDTVLVASGVYEDIDNVRLSFPRVDAVLLSVGGPSATTIDGSASPWTEWPWIVCERQAAGAMTIDGFTVRDFRSGAIQAYCDGHVTVANCVFEDVGDPNENYIEGGAIRLDAVEAVVRGCTFRNVHTRSVGGAIWIGNGSVATLRDLRFYGCSGGLGGAVNVDQGSTAQLFDCIFDDNHSGHGGAIGVLAEASVRIQGSLFTRNGAQYGGAIDCLGDLTIDTSTITQNTAGDGAGISFGWGDGSFRRTILRDNCAHFADAAHDLRVWSGTMRLSCSALDSTGILSAVPISYQGSLVWDDPEFCAPEACDVLPGPFGDYTLSTSSPCAAEWSPCGERIGAFDVACGPSGLGGCCVDGTCILSTAEDCASQGGWFLGEGVPCVDQGCTPTTARSTTWGAVKRLFR